MKPALIWVFCCIHLYDPSSYRMKVGSNAGSQWDHQSPATPGGCLAYSALDGYQHVDMWSMGPLLQDHSSGQHQQGNWTSWEVITNKTIKLCQGRLNFLIRDTDEILSVPWSLNHQLFQGRPATFVAPLTPTSSSSEANQHWCNATTDGATTRC